MTKKERKEIARNTVDSFMKCFKDNLKYANLETIEGNRRFIEGMIVGYDYTGIITQDDRVVWLKEIYKEFSQMSFEKEIDIARNK